MNFINYTLFTIGGDTPVLLIDLLTSVVGLTCVFLAGRNNKYNFWVGYVYSALLFLMLFPPLASDVLEQEPLRQFAPSAYIFRNQCLRTLQMDTSAKGRAELCGQQRT